MKFLNFDRVLCLSPHPDDVEYSISGTILKCSETQFDILCLTKGGDCDETSGDNRIEEVRGFWTVAYQGHTGPESNYTIYFSDVKYLKEKSTDEWINYIECNFTKMHDYDCILVPSEYDSHFEHVIVSSFAAPLARVNPYSIIQYRSPSTLDKWVPNFFMPLAGIYDLKKEMLGIFKSQLHHQYFKNNVIDGFHTNFQCMKKGLGPVESYKIITLYE